MKVTEKDKKLLLSLGLALWSFLFVLPVLLKTGPNVVTLTYAEGSQKFWNGINPYEGASPGRDLFFYPPFFAFFWKVLSVWGELPSSLIWVFLNALVFWMGVTAWVEIKKQQSVWHWFFLIATAMELDISLRYQQANALLAGLVLLGMAYLKDRKAGRAGFLFALATHLKVFPLLIAAALVLPFHLAFLGSYCLWLLVLLLGPIAVVGFSETWFLHFDQLRATTSDFSKRELLDLATCLKRLGLAEWGIWLQKMTGLVGAVTLLFYRLKRSFLKFSAGVWYTAFVTVLLAVTPKTESPTFVWMAPGYLLVGEKLSKKMKWFLTSIIFCITLVYTSLIPKSWVYFLTKDYASKTLGNWIFWGLCSFLLLKEFSRKTLPKL